LYESALAAVFAATLIWAVEVPPFRVFVFAPGLDFNPPLLVLLSRLSVPLDALSFFAGFFVGWASEEAMPTRKKQRESEKKKREREEETRTEAEEIKKQESCDGGSC